jgi:hypothetical protein
LFFEEAFPSRPCRPDNIFQFSTATALREDITEMNFVGVIPSGFQTLTFGKDFNQSIHCVSLPNSLQTLTFFQ